MRIKNLPKRQTQQSDNFNCIINKNCYNQQLQIKNINEIKKVSEPLDLTMSQSSLDYYQQLDKSASTKANDSSSSSVSTISNVVALDLSSTTINNNKLSSKNIEYESILPSTSKNSGELKNLFLYKMLTDPSFVDDVKKLNNQNIFTCEFCKRNFLSQIDLYKHQNDTKNNTNNNISCCACGKIFSQRRYLRYHQRCHSDKDKFTCDICTRKYSRLDNLTRHNTFHTNPDKFPCSLCERTFARKDLLNKHIKGHENKYRYHCDICHRYFKGPLSLENHNKIFHPTI